MRGMGVDEEVVEAKRMPMEAKRMPGVEILEL
jgi:hypothetical protein